MPLKAGRSRAVVESNIRDMLRAAHPHDQAVAASLRAAGIKRKGTPMAKTKSYGHDGGDGMAGEKGMSPRKAMASGMTHGGSFGAESLESMSAGQHPDHAAHTGMKPHLQDHERATPPAIHHTKHHLPAQAAPHHGPHHPGGHGLHHTREPNA